MAAGRHFEIYEKLNNFRTVGLILTKFGAELRLDVRTDSVMLKTVIISKSKMAANEKLKFTKN